MSCSCNDKHIDFCHKPKVSDWKLDMVRKMIKCLCKCGDTPVDVPPEPIKCIATTFSFNEYNVIQYRPINDYFIRNANFQGELLDEHYFGSEVDIDYFLSVATGYARVHSIVYNLPNETRPVESVIGVEIEGNFIFANYIDFTGMEAGLEYLLYNSTGTNDINYPGLPTYPEGTDVTRYFIYFWGYLEQYNPTIDDFEPMNNGELMIVGSSYLDVIQQR